MSASLKTPPIAGPPPTRPLGWRGNMLKFFGDPIAYMVNAHRDYGSVVAFTQGGNGNLISPTPNCPGTFFGFGPVCNQQMLSNTSVFHVSQTPAATLNQPVITRLLSGMFSMNGEKHKQQRRLMMPAFHKKQIETYRDTMLNITAAQLNRWQAGEQRDIAHDMMELTLQIACKTLFGIDSTMIGLIMQQWMMMNLSPAVMALRVNIPGAPYHRFLRLGAQLDIELRAIIDQKRASTSNEGDVLSMLINMRDENGDQMTEDELIGQANILFFAGHETTANTLVWTLFLLNQHPQVLADLLDELDGVLRGDAPTVEQLGQLPLLDRVIKESMRILPPVPFGVRIVTQDTELDGRPIPQWSELVYSQYVTHHLPEIYSEPEQFNPDRWQTIDPSPYEYLPFGAGARMCIGATFAMMEAKIVLAMILQRYRLALISDTTIDRQTTITMTPKQGLKMVVHAQDRTFEKVSVKGNIHEMVKLYDR